MGNVDFTLKVKVLVAQSCLTLWTVAHQTPLSMEFSRQEYWSGLPFLSSFPGLNRGLLHCRQILYRLIHQLSPSLLKRSCNISHAPKSSTELVVWNMPGSDSLADLGEPPGETRGNWSSPGGHRCWWKPREGQGGLFYQEDKHWIESSLQFISPGIWPHAPTSQHQS